LAKIRVALVGVGNCASSLVQGVKFYRNATGNRAIPGIMHLDLGGYHIADIAAFDIAEGKVGRDLSEAIAASPTIPSASPRSARPGWTSGAARPTTASAAICAKR
jgi:myo-inositol-1-phosphate synthase